MSTPPIIDCLVSYGPHPAKDPDERWTLEHLLEDLDLYRISGALVRHEQSFHYDAMHVNRRLARELAPYRDRLFPCWGAVPHQAGDFPRPDDFMRAMRDHDVRAVHLTPALHGYPIHADVLAPLAEVLNPRRILVLTTLAELGNEYTSAKTLCDRFNGCPVVIAEATWANWRLMIAILDNCPNACIEFSAFQANRAVEFFAERYGVERLVFGSGLPRRSAGAARGFVDWSLMDEGSVAAFAGGNLSRLLGLSPPPLAVLEPGDRLVRDALRGDALGVPVLDAHCHVLDAGLNGGGSRYVMIGGDCPRILTLAERMGVDATAMMSWSGTVSMDVRSGNRLVADLVKRFPQRVLGLSSVDPTHQTPDEIRETVQHLHGDLGFRGLKPYTRNNIPYNDPGYAPYFQFADEHRLYALLHTGPTVGGMGAVTDLAGRYPNVTFLVAHSGGSWSLARQVAEAARTHENIMAELTYTAAINGIIEWLCERMGSDRVLFGTDAPMRDPRPQLGWCVFTRLSESDKRRIVGGNFARILQRGTLPGQVLPEIIRRMAE